jgi:ABC-2 type transport system ATP-binding protein
MIVENIKKSYGKRVILEDISFKAEAGTCVGILGSNGSGKSTLLSVLAGGLKADGGNFTYEGEDLFKNNKVKGKVLGYVPQGTPLIEELSARDNLRLWYSNADMKMSLEKGVLNMLGIGDFIDVTVSKMSGGMKKRLSIGCAVAHAPNVLLLDEPCAALDLPCKENISDYLTEFKKAGGIIILATHDVQELPLCDTIYILKDGRLSLYDYDGDNKKLAGVLR